MNFDGVVVRSEKSFCFHCVSCTKYVLNNYLQYVYILSSFEIGSVLFLPVGKFKFNLNVRVRSLNGHVQTDFKIYENDMEKSRKMKFFL